MDEWMTFRFRGKNKNTKMPKILGICPFSTNLLLSLAILLLVQNTITPLEAKINPKFDNVYKEKDNVIINLADETAKANEGNWTTLSPEDNVATANGSAAGATQILTSSPSTIMEVQNIISSTPVPSNSDPIDCNSCKELHKLTRLMIIKFRTMLIANFNMMCKHLSAKEEKACLKYVKFIGVDTNSMLTFLLEEEQAKTGCESFFKCKD